MYSTLPACHSWFNQANGLCVVFNVIISLVTYYGCSFSSAVIQLIKVDQIFILPESDSYVAYIQ